MIHVQPVALKPVGTPIQAVPLGGPGSYGGGISHGIPPYPAPGGYSDAIPSSGYGSPVSSYNPPIYDPSGANDGPHSSFKVIHESGGSGIKPSNVVKHVHSHTHIYNGQGSSDYLYGGSRTDSIHSASSIFSDKTGSELPIIPPHQSVIHQSGNRCQCVPISYCSSSDIVGRNTNLLPMLDARTKKTDILSTAPDDTVKEHSLSSGPIVVSEEKEKQVLTRSKREATITKVPIVQAVSMP